MTDGICFVVQPFAWASREFLRKKLVGETVMFAVNNTDANGREYSTVSYKGEDLARMMVAAGWAQVRVRKEQPDGKKFMITP